jgi:YfiH family protein
MSPGWLTPDWPAPSGVRALSSFRVGGHSTGVYASLNLGDHVGDAPAVVAANRRALRDAAALPDEPRWLRQVHGIAVADLDAPPVGPAGVAPEADASLTRTPGRPCAILTADCVPVLFAVAAPGSVAPAVAAAHAGWRGLAAGVLAATVTALAAEPVSLVAWIGPCIGGDAYEVGEEVRTALLATVPGAAAAFNPSSRGRWLADLALLARLQLRQLGVTRVFGGSECTYRDRDRYFSHRRDGQTGRQATLIWLDDR